MLRSDDAKGWKIGGCGRWSGFGTTPTARTTPSWTPAPHCRVASRSHGRPAGRDAPVAPLVREQVVGPRLLDDVEALLEGGAVRSIDGVVLVRHRAVNPVRLLGHDVHPAPLVAAREPGVGAAAGHVVEHRDVLGDPDRVAGREHDAELAHADALRLQADEQIEEHRIVRQLEALDVEVVLGEADRVVAEIVGAARLLAQLGQHSAVEIAASPARPCSISARLPIDGR